MPVRAGFLRLDGRFGIVTGGARGIGLADLSQAGRGRSDDRRLGSRRGAARPRRSDRLRTRAATPAYQVDVTSPASIADGLAESLAGRGPVDLLVNNAGIAGRSAPLTDLTDADWDEIVRSDLDQRLLLLPGGAAVDAQAGRGSIVNVASVTGKEGNPSQVPYSAAKAGVIALTKALAREVAPEIRVNCVAPALIRTRMLDSLPPHVVEYALERIPIGRVGNAGGGGGCRSLPALRRCELRDRAVLRRERRTQHLLAIRRDAHPAARPRSIARTAMGSTATSRSRWVFMVQRFVLRTGRTRLRGLWAAAYRALARGATAYVTLGEADASTYVRGGVAAGDILPGLSDVDTAVVLPDGHAPRETADARVCRRWRRLSRMLPFVELLVERPVVYDEGSLRELAGASALTYGFDRREGGQLAAGYFGPHATFDWLRQLERPGLHGLGADWRLLRGPDRRPAVPPHDAQTRLIAGWLELLFWWRWAVPACMEPRGPRTAALCAKLIAEPTRIWLWLAHGEKCRSRPDVLRAGLRKMPEEEGLLRFALALLESLPDSPQPPLAEALDGLARISGPGRPSCSTPRLRAPPRSRCDWRAGMQPS